MGYTVIPTITTGDVATAAWGNTHLKDNITFLKTFDVLEIAFVIDGGGALITTGEKGHIRVPFGCDINRNSLLADQSGSIVIDIWKDTLANFPPANGDSITASAPPTITTDTDSEDATLTGWTTAITADDILAFNVDSVTSIQRVTLGLKVTRN